MIRTCLIQAMAGKVNVSDRSYNNIGFTLGEFDMGTTNIQLELKVFTENAIDSTIQVLHGEVIFN